MLDGVSLDQLRCFVTAVEEGSFSAAARKLRRSQSVVSEMVGALEAQIGVVLFDRSGRYPRLTAQGTVLLTDARAIVGSVETLKARARGMASGLEAELSVVVDVFFPFEIMTAAAREFRARFPQVGLRLYSEALGAAYQPIFDGRAGLGIVGSLPSMPPGLTEERLGAVRLVMVAAHDHPLAAWDGLIPRAALAHHTQLVLTDRSDLSKGRDLGVMSSSTWRLADLFAKHAFLLDGLGWGGMPLHLVNGDIAAGRLVRLAIEDVPADGLLLPMSAVYPVSRPPGPAGRWLIERLRRCSEAGRLEHMTGARPWPGVPLPDPSEKPMESAG
ncbi:LysR family transcriptional regulator [Ameyamaea chiangmaiensis NBRC 103196]|uniref:LysR family transcriptional regulator n=1 Tax=Ameyamaea chiangmaiensis TaxID=442969 RepID=A0A850PCD4_9PROT|nr:LysR family transcriptional regulator [Ameyamaea chiangmaiensis]MBS4074145.1 LysR family transcriptional regulator [Ameyamaea chiangmaiensis]NVN39956.1 LysR family transcriptional regulator [Ameyamaea chiangmaiensis]GBQ71029.1 LysR family transcriptional regulator [Ameyamaea chiangmaiensis NBRC 103196]